jgi:hypothetical protein
MRTTDSAATVRLYHLEKADPVAQTLFYGPLAEALVIAHQQPQSVQSGLWLATENDIIAFLDLEGD